MLREKGLRAPDSNVICFIQRKISVEYIKVNLKYDAAYLCPFIDHEYLIQHVYL